MKNLKLFSKTEKYKFIFRLTSAPENQNKSSDSPKNNPKSLPEIKKKRETQREKIKNIQAAEKADRQKDKIRIKDELAEAERQKNLTISVKSITASFEAGDTQPLCDVLKASLAKPILTKTEYCTIADTIETTFARELNGKSVEAIFPAGEKALFVQTEATLREWEIGVLDGNNFLLEKITPTHPFLEKFVAADDDVAMEPEVPGEFLV